MDIDEFLEGVLTNDHSIFIKRLSANDTGATGAHQAGPYLPKEVAFALAPLLRNGFGNPDQVFTTCVASHDVRRETRLVWYNEKSRDECRVTRWATAGKKNSVISSEQTGAIAVFGFAATESEGILHAWAWICSDDAEEDAVEARFGEIEPGMFVFRHRGKTIAVRPAPISAPCKLPMSHLPDEWGRKFPDTAAIVGKTLELLPMKRADPDQRLILRRECEFQLFQTIEAAHVLPQIRLGFATIDTFINVANAVTNRRRSRSGRSLELHLERIFLENNVAHAHGMRTEGKSTPDFLFPSVHAYTDSKFDATKLRMLGAKTTCKDRWRQVLKEADRIPVKHIATLQEGVSKDQFAEMKKAGVVLVVPKPLHLKYPKEIRAELKTLRNFIDEVHSLEH
jgi:hypothetical protein